MAAARIRYNEYSYPVSRLDILLDHLIAVSKKYPLSFNRMEFTAEIGATPASNGPQSKLTDMIEFGMLNKNDQTYTISDWGKSVIQNVERSATIEKMVRKIPLWDQLFQKVGKKPTKDEFAKAFQQITRVDAAVITKDLTRIWNSYTGDFSCLNKTPPFSTRSAILGKKRIPKGVKITQVPKTEFSPIKVSVHPRIIPVPQDQTNNVDSAQSKSTQTVWPPLNEPLIIEIGSVKFEAKDASSIRFARFLIDVKENGLRLGEDYK